MKKLFALFTGLSALFATPAFAVVGGPFDNGGYSLLFEANGVYQAVLTYKNGSGFAYFTPDNSLSPELTNSQGSNGTTQNNNTQLLTAQLTVANRSFLYYKGVTYLGMCTGYMDITA